MGNGSKFFVIQLIKVVDSYITYRYHIATESYDNDLKTMAKINVDRE